MRVNKIGLSLAAVVLTAAAGAGTGAAVALAGDSSSAAATDLHAAYAFDVTDLQYVVGYADNVFVGEVEGVAATDADQARTLYTVNVLDVLEGDLASQVQVSQLGFIDEDGGVHVVEYQPLLEPGSTYVLVTSDEPNGEQTLIGGPVASVKVNDPTDRLRVVTQYVTAVQNQIFPPGVPR